MKASTPTSVDLSLAELLSLSSSKLAKKLNDAQVVVVRSQVIDKIGEAGFTFHARQVMDTVIDNIAWAIRKLAAAGVAYAVVTADHGHLFFATDRDESMRTDPPGGYTVELHRRGWIGRGGSTPPGASESPRRPLDTTRPRTSLPSRVGVFRAGGDLAYHHGGPTLQEMVIPVITIRSAASKGESDISASVTVTEARETITNRISLSPCRWGAGR